MIIIGADFVPTKTNIDLFKNGNTRELFGQELESILQQADYRIFNLEMPLCNTLHPIKKNGKCLSAPIEAINGYCEAKINLFTLANNHILDQDVQGLDSTCETLSKNNISYVGVGHTFHEAAEPYIFIHNEKKIGVYACCEHEFSVVTSKRAGANPFDPLESFDHIFSLKKQCDYVIVLYHGGKEYYRYPSPMLQKLCRKMIEKGADLIICQHSHCIGCEEKYMSGTIVYGQGNFLFDNSSHEMWQTSILIEIKNDYSINYIPIVKQENVVRLATDQQSKQIMIDFQTRSKKIQSDDFVKESYAKFAKDNIQSYLYLINGHHSILYRLIDKLFRHKLSIFIMKKIYQEKEKMILKNYFKCEAISELIIEGISDSIE